MPDELRRAIAGSEIPAEAVVTRRRVCNRLALEPGAFARRHSLDAVDWRPWSQDVLAEASRLRRPIFVLSGFSSCASCGELSRVTLADRSVARALNRGFIPVLVDREERPDVDAYVMQAVQVLTGGAGWPAAAFLDDQGRPFEAFSWGAAGTSETNLARIVGQLSRRIALGGGTIEEKGEATAEKMLARSTIDASGPVPGAGACARALRGYLSDSFDESSGSFGPPPLFPRAPALDFLLRLHGDEKALSMVTTSLAKLRVSPLADPVAGGFHRYAEQAGWNEPVREKMLADNAAIAGVFVDAAAKTGRSDLQETARRTIEFLMRELRLENGAFAASIDATSAPPLRDERILADANGLAVSALVRAASVLSEPKYFEAAQTAARFLDSKLVREGRVLHCAYADGRSCSDGYLPDQAMVALAFLDLAESAGTAGSHWLQAARAIADALPEHFEHASAGGFFLTADDAPPLPLRYKPALDGAVASGNSAAAMLYVRLAARGGSARDAAIAHRTFEAFSEILMLRPLTLPAMVSALLEQGGSSTSGEGSQLP